MILKKISFTCFEIKVLLDTLSDSQIGHYVKDTRQFRNILADQIRNFNQFMQNFIIVLNKFSEQCPQFKQLKAELQKYNSDEQTFRLYLLNYLKELDREKSEGGEQIKRVEMSVVDCLMAEDILKTFGQVSTPVGSYPYLSRCQKLGPSELDKFNQLKMKYLKQLIQ